MTQDPLALKFKLHELSQQVELGDTEFLKVFKPMNEPLGTIELLPFHVDRTHTGNLPVFTDIRSGGSRQCTVVKKIYGDVNQFKEELAKIVSNAPIEDKMGRLEVNGIHSQKIKLWLTRLGF